MNRNKRWAKRRQQYRPHSVRSRLNMCWCLCKYTYANVYWNRFYITLSAMFSLHFSAIAIFIKWTFKYRNGMNETKRKKRRGKIERMQKKDTYSYQWFKARNSQTVKLHTQNRSKYDDLHQNTKQWYFRSISIKYFAPTGKKTVPPDQVRKSLQINSIGICHAFAIDTFNEKCMCVSIL